MWVTYLAHPISDHRLLQQILVTDEFQVKFSVKLLLLLSTELRANTKQIREAAHAFAFHLANCVCCEIVSTETFSDRITMNPQSKFYGTIKSELWKNLYCEWLLYHNCAFVRKADQQRLMQSVNFRCLCCIGNTSALLHLLLRSWLLKVDSKRRLCWLSARLYIRTQIAG